MIVYTAIFGNYDQLKSISLPEGWRAIVYSDKQIKCEGWECFQVNMIFSPVLMARYYKTKLCPSGRTIWIDANLEYRGDWKVLDLDGLTVMEHPERNCIYQEAQACIRLKKDMTIKIVKQVQQYREEGYPENNQLAATGIVIRNNHDALNLAWWQEILNNSHRDQLSFNYVCWKMKIQYKTIPFLKDTIKTRHALGCY